MGHAPFPPRPDQDQYRAAARGWDQPNVPIAARTVAAPSPPGVEHRAVATLHGSSDEPVRPRLLPVSVCAGGEGLMQVRIAFGKVSSEGVAALRGVEAYVRRCGLERSLLELVRMRASQINRCGYCLDMHSKDARVAGES